VLSAIFMILFILLVPQMESRLARGHQTGHRSHLSPVIETLAAPGLDYRSSVVLADLQEPELASRSLEVAAFTQLRAKQLLNLSSSVPILVPVRVVSTKAPERPRGPPQEICDSNTIGFSEVHTVIRSTHKYLASLSFIQKWALFCFLRECGVEVVERQTLGGVQFRCSTAPFSDVQVLEGDGD